MNVTLGECVALLDERRRAVCDEMRACGSPVPACDADFNALVAEHTELVAALARLVPLSRGEVRIAHPLDD